MQQRPAPLATPTPQASESTGGSPALQAASLSPGRLEELRHQRRLERFDAERRETDRRLSLLRDFQTKAGAAHRRNMALLRSGNERNAAPAQGPQGLAPGKKKPAPFAVRTNAGHLMSPAPQCCPGGGRRVEGGRDPRKMEADRAPLTGEWRLLASATEDSSVVGVVSLWQDGEEIRGTHAVEETGAAEPCSITGKIVSKPGAREDSDTQAVCRNILWDFVDWEAEFEGSVSHDDARISGVATRRDGTQFPVHLKRNVWQTPLESLKPCRTPPTASRDHVHAAEPSETPHSRISSMSPDPPPPPPPLAEAGDPACGSPELPPDESPAEGAPSDPQYRDSWLAGEIDVGVFEGPRAGGAFGAEPSATRNPRDGSTADRRTGAANGDIQHHDWLVSGEGDVGSFEGTRAGEAPAVKPPATRNPRDGSTADRRLGATSGDTQHHDLWLAGGEIGVGSFEAPRAGGAHAVEPSASRNRDATTEDPRPGAASEAQHHDRLAGGEIDARSFEAPRATHNPRDGSTADTQHHDSRHAGGEIDARSFEAPRATHNPRDGSTADRRPGAPNGDTQHHDSWLAGGETDARSLEAPRAGEPPAVQPRATLNPRDGTTVVDRRPVAANGDTQHHNWLAGGETDAQSFEAPRAVAAPAAEPRVTRNPRGGSTADQRPAAAGGGRPKPQQPPFAAPPPRACPAATTQRKGSPRLAGVQSRYLDFTAKSRLPGADDCARADCEQPGTKPPGAAPKPAAAVGVKRSNSAASTGKGESIGARGPRSSSSSCEPTLPGSSRRDSAASSAGLSQAKPRSGTPRGLSPSTRTNRLRVGSRSGSAGAPAGRRPPAGGGGSLANPRNSGGAPSSCSSSAAAPHGDRAPFPPSPSAVSTADRSPAVFVPGPRPAGGAGAERAEKPSFVASSQQQSQLQQQPAPKRYTSSSPSASMASRLSGVTANRCAVPSALQEVEVLQLASYRAAVQVQRLQAHKKQQLEQGLKQLRMISALTQSIMEEVNQAEITHEEAWRFRALKSVQGEVGLAEDVVREVQNLRITYDALHHRLTAAEAPLELTEVQFDVQAAAAGLCIGRELLAAIDGTVSTSAGRQPAALLAALSNFNVMAATTYAEMRKLVDFKNQGLLLRVISARADVRQREYLLDATA
ncbi:hypothetical protein DIPPA_01541 [Diplonema papillatum]|nr:hypothetical protein DIPPA_01541 [Diplonema papillatum]